MAPGGLVPLYVSKKKERVKQAAALILIGFSGLMVYFLFFDPDPSRKLIVDDLSKPAVVRLTAPYTDKPVHALNLTMVGSQAGHIRIEVCSSDTICNWQDTLSGSETIRMNGDWYNPFCVVKLTPLEKSAGKVELTYKFFGI